MDWQILLAHRHWLTIGFRSRSVRLCARCTGTVVGYLLSIMFLKNLDLTGFLALSPTIQFTLAFILGLPSAVDWLAQTWKLKESTNNRRVLVGILIGSGVALLTVSTLPRTLKTLALAIPASVTISAGYIGLRLKGRRTS
ncbi:MAG: DUF2085 domain-containing protein [Candidatus Bathyarchaeia archaeon]